MLKDKHLFCPECQTSLSIPENRIGGGFWECPTCQARFQPGISDCQEELPREFPFSVEGQSQIYTSIILAFFLLFGLWFTEGRISQKYLKQQIDGTPFETIALTQQSDGTLRKEGYLLSKDILDLQVVILVAISLAASLLIMGIPGLLDLRLFTSEKGLSLERKGYKRELLWADILKVKLLKIPPFIKNCSSPEEPRKITQINLTTPEETVILAGREDMENLASIIQKKISPKTPVAILRSDVITGYVWLDVVYFLSLAFLPALGMAWFFKMKMSFFVYFHVFLAGGISLALLLSRHHFRDFPWFRRFVWIGSFALGLLALAMAWQGMGLALQSLKV